MLVEFAERLDVDVDAEELAERDERELTPCVVVNTAVVVTVFGADAEAARLFGPVAGRITSPSTWKRSS